MTVAELIAKLQEMPQDMQVHRGDQAWGTSPPTQVYVARVSEDTFDGQGVIKRNYGERYINYDAVVIL